MRPDDAGRTTEDDFDPLSEEELAAEAEIESDADPEDSDGPEEPEDDEEEVVFAEHRVPTLTVLRSALEWAFEGESVPPGYLDRCAEHARLMLQAARKMNLTKIVDPKEVAAKHYLDSYRMTIQLSLLGRRILDVGTGAGFPGVPIALAEPNASVVLIDSTKKKIDFLQKAIETMGIPNCTAVWGRAEEHLLKERYDMVVMRAISSVRENVRLLRKVRHSLHDLVMLKGASWSREVRAGEREAERLGFRLDTIIEHELPGEMGQRAFLVYRAPGGHGR